MSSNVHSGGHSMSDSAHGADSGDEDGVNLKLIIIVGVVSIVVFVASAIVAWLILRGDRARYEAQGVAEPPTGLTNNEEIGMVDFVPFDGDGRLERWSAEKSKQLNSYGWADRKKGFIHIPIDEAMKEVIHQAAVAPAGGAAGSGSGGPK